MTKDVIALTPTMPDLRTLLAGLYAGGPDLTVSTIAEGAVIQLCAPDGRPLVAIEAPTLVQVPGETRRLLGESDAVDDGPVWWTEARASTAVAEAEHLAGSFAGRLTTVLGGAVWPPQAATTNVIPLTTDIAAVPVPDTGIPAVDVLTTRAAVVIQDRPIVPLTSWLSDALRHTTAADRALQIVTPPTSRLTLPLRTALRGLPNRWVIQHPDQGFYDGLSGAQLHWKNGIFTPIHDDTGQATLAAAFTPTTATQERQLLLNLRTRHRADTDLTLGGALETAFQHFTDAPPAGWSTAEPVNLSWSRRKLTELARNRAPQPTWLTAIGHPHPHPHPHPHRPAIATIRIQRTPAGVEEDITLALGYATDEEPPLHAIETLAAELDAAHGLATLLTSLRFGRSDLTIPPHFEPPPIPVSLTLGSEEPQNTGRTRVDLPPAIAPPTSLGPRSHPVLHYRLSDGNDPHAWARLQELARHLQQA
ncbi:DUF6177 family protein [Streptomyces sp. NPDC048156]|uniref:DUF6177 family protein n=1 Tax=Streptomyces sp. NPDC048156 TaxID=3365502 RepID=UPI003721A05D